MGLTTIGWREWVSLPQLGVDAVKAKFDTGARSSTLHAWDVDVVDRPGGPLVRFVVHPRQHDLSLTVVTTAELVEWRDVRSSNGSVERRPVIRTPVVIAGRRVRVELTLTRRDEMGGGGDRPYEAPAGQPRRRTLTPRRPRPGGHGHRRPPPRSRS
jgi:hypothetical protein